MDPPVTDPQPTPPASPAPQPQPTTIERGQGISVTWTNTLETGGEKK